MPPPPFLDRLLLALNLREPTLTELSRRLRPAYDEATSPEPLWELPDFRTGVRLMAGQLDAGDPIERFAFGMGPIVALMSAEAANVTSDDALAMQRLLALLPGGWPWTRIRAIQLLHERMREPILIPILLMTGPPDEQGLLDRILPVMTRAARERRESESGERFGERLAQLPPERLQFVEAAVSRLANDLPPGMVEEVMTRARRRVPLEALNAIGRVWETLPEGAADPEVIADPGAEPLLDDLETRLAGPEPHSVLLVGESGSGKTALVRQLARRLQRRGWVVFEAGAADLVAGQSYVGMLEQRVRQLVEGLSGRDVVWVVPSFRELAFAGATLQDPSSVLDLLLPVIERGGVRVLGETRPAAFERLAARAPRVRTAMAVVRIEPRDEAATLALARGWGADAERLGVPWCEESVLRESAQLARQYLSDMVLPGALLKLLRLTSERLRVPGGAATDGPPPRFGLDDVLETLATLTGLPLTLLDDRRQLALDGLRAHFERRVMGQPEAVDRLVERVAMIKAGVSDPRRPLGVFLFVGPTGTGKTEIARTLAEYLFGSADRMIRLDMSEYQTPDTLENILGDRDPFGGTQALVNRIRRQPFAVVLLDEFEKAHPRVWDLFLQVFDDGRLTDRRGDVADFRHAIVIMTSNLGAAIPAGARLGFNNDDPEFAPGSVLRIIDQTFRREFVNRLDHIIVFRPLARATMRDIVRRELADVFQRRGLRNRDWAVEWDDSAIDLLLDKGFSVDLGARPLRRAIEQHVLAPLATTIVRHEVPAGDQFLFVRAEGGAIRVRFVDPDAPDQPTPAEAESHAGAEMTEGAPTPRDLAARARGTPEELDALRAHLDALELRVGGEAWQARARAALEAMRAEGFWRSPGRFELLGRAENHDRVRAALQNARSLAERLSGRSRRTHAPADLLTTLGQQVYLLESACDALDAGETWEAFVAVRPIPDSDPEAAEAFGGRIARMYVRWAERRRMMLEVLDPGGRGRRWIAAISGFAALRLLRPEHGLHLEEFEHGHETTRRRVEVRVAAQPHEPASTPAELLAQATRAVTGVEPGTPVIVRRYRAEPSPLVRDAVRGFRTGRLDLVLDGQFDLMR